MRYWLLIGCLLVAHPVWAGRVLVEKATGKLIEYQEKSTPGTLLRNIEQNPQYGYTLDQVEEKVVTSEEWAVIREEWINVPRRAKEAENQPIDIPIEDFGAGAAGALTILAGRGLILRVRKKRVP